MNRQGHAEHHLLDGANLEERIDWHAAHSQACGCRPIPPEIAQASNEAFSKPD